MHVCHFCDLTFEGEFFRLMTTGLTERGVRVSLVELGAGKAPTWLKGLDGVSYLSLGATSKRHYPNAVRRLASYLRDGKVDILHTHLFFAGVIGVLSKWLRRETVVVLMRHHTSIVRMLGWGVHIAADKWMAEKADHVITVSNAARRYMFETDGIRRDEIEVVNIGFDFDKLAADAVRRAAVRREFGFADDDLVIGYVATLVAGKGHSQLLTAFRHVAADIPQVRLFLIGEGSLPEVTEAAREMPGKVMIAGWRDDIPDCLSAMDIFVQPSLSEAFSRVLVEAMGVELPVIATRTGGAEEVIDSGKNGILIEPDDPDALFDEITRLCVDAGLRRVLGTLGRQSVCERFSSDRMVDGFVTLYESWLGIDKVTPES